MGIMALKTIPFFKRRMGVFPFCFFYFFVAGKTKIRNPFLEIDTTNKAMRTVTDFALLFSDRGMYILGGNKLFIFLFMTLDTGFDRQSPLRNLNTTEQKPQTCKA